MDERSSPRKPVPAITCSGCPATWTASSVAHCGGCHATFSGVTLFDRHRSVVGDRGTCADPATLTDMHGDELCEYRDGMWRFPEMDEATKAARFGASRT